MTIAIRFNNYRKQSSWLDTVFIPGKRLSNYDIIVDSITRYWDKLRLGVENIGILCERIRVVYVWPRVFDLHLDCLFLVNRSPANGARRLLILVLLRIGKVALVVEKMCLVACQLVHLHSRLELNQAD